MKYSWEHSAEIILWIYMRPFLINTILSVMAHTYGTGLVRASSSSVWSLPAMPYQPQQSRSVQHNTMSVENSHKIIGV